MKLISRKRTRNTPLKDAMAKMIAEFIIGRQLALVKVLKQFERRCSLRRKKIFFLFFCVTGIAWLVFILCGALLNNKQGKADRPVTVTGQLPPVSPPPVAKDSLTRHGRKY